MLGQLWAVLSRDAKRRYVTLACLSLASSFLQTVGVGAVSVFFSVLLGGKLPEVIRPFLNPDNFLALGSMVLGTALAGTASSGLATYFGVKISWQQYEDLAGRLLSQYLSNPYEWHLQQNSANLINAVLTEARAVCGILQQCVAVQVRGAEVVLLVCLLIVVKPLVALAAFTSFSAIYWLLFSVNRRFVRGQGRVLVQANEERQKAVTEALNGIKAVKVSGDWGYFQDRFIRAARKTANATVNILYFSLLPRYFIEALLFGGLVGFVLLANARGWPIHESIPLLALYGAAALRILPAVQQLYLSAVTIVSNQAVVEKVANGLLHPPPPATSASTGCQLGERGPLFELQEITYRYPEAEHPSLQNLNLTIYRGEKIGVVGTTGAGKTTLVDILLQLLNPTSGSLNIASSNEGHDSLVAYVPQQLHFLDDTVAANIAWGVPDGERDLKKVIAAAKKARIHEHIAGQPEGYQTMVGEQSVRLSGGQRQRIGIARALYHNPALLVLDEASNALDPETERQVLDGLLGEDLTLVVIAHRISTLKKCSRLLVMREGGIVSQGSYEELLGQCAFFRNLALADLGQVSVESSGGASNAPSEKLD